MILPVSGFIMKKPLLKPVLIKKVTVFSGACKIQYYENSLRKLTKHNDKHERVQRRKVKYVCKVLLPGREF